MYWRRRLTRLEAAVYGVIAAILLAVSASRLLDLMEIAERAAVETTVTRVNAALNIRLAYELVRGNKPDANAWLRRNPFELADAWPPNFVSGVEPFDLSAIERGSWSYDQGRAELIYLPRSRAILDLAKADRALRFRLVQRPSDRTYVLVPTPSVARD
jgi:hypothetical protein